MMQGIKADLSERWDLAGPSKKVPGHRGNPALVGALHICKQQYYERVTDGPQWS